MIFSHYLFEQPIDFSDCLLQRLVIESPAFMGSMVGELSDQVRGNKGRFILSKSYDELDISRKLNLVIDPFALDTSSKDIVAGLHKRVAEYLENGDNYLQTNTILCELVNYIIDKTTDLEVSVEIDELAVQAVLKSTSLKLMEAENLSEKVHDYVNFASKYAGKEMSVIVGIDHFVSIDEYQSLLKSMQYLNIPILFIESEFKADGIPTKIIDADCCELNL